MSHVFAIPSADAQEIKLIHWEHYLIDLSIVRRDRACATLRGSMDVWEYAYEYWLQVGEDARRAGDARGMDGAQKRATACRRQWQIANAKLSQPR